MSHDQKSCDIYKNFNQHKQTSTTLEHQPHHTMRPLSVDKLNLVISRLHPGQTTCQISSSNGFSIGTISKSHSEHFSDLPSPLVVILSNSPQPMSVMQLTLLPLGRLKQQYKSQNMDEKVPIHPTINPACIPRPILLKLGCSIWNSLSLYEFLICSIAFCYFELRSCITSAFVPTC